MHHMTPGDMHAVDERLRKSNFARMCNQEAELLPGHEYNFSALPSVARKYLVPPRSEHAEVIGWRGTSTTLLTLLLASRYLVVVP